MDLSHSGRYSGATVIRYLLGPRNTYVLPLTSPAMQKDSNLELRVSSVLREPVGHIFISASRKCKKFQKLLVCWQAQAQDTIFLVKKTLALTQKNLILLNA